MHTLSFASSGTRAMSASLNSASWHQHVDPGEALCMTQALSPPHSGQLNGVRVDFSPGMGLFAQQ
jgi:hypothetical protein